VSKEKQMSLVGKFVFYSGKDFHQYGEIVGEHGDYVLVKWDRFHGGPSPSDESAVLMALATMASKPNKDGPDWEFYDSREKLNAFHRWMESGCPDGDAVEAADAQAKLN
jgi:hypothetical protein